MVRPSNAPRRPASAEDYAPEGSGESLIPKGVSVGNILWNAAKSIPAGVVDTVTAAYHDQRPEDVALGPGRVLAPLIRAAGAGAVSEGRKVMTSKDRLEAAAHSLAASIPLLGPAAAQAGEDIGSGDPARIESGGGNAIGLVGGMVAPAVVGKIAPRVSPALATIGEQIASKGKTLATKVVPVAMEVAKTGAVELAAHALGGQIGMGSVARLLLKTALESAKKNAPATATGGTLVRDAAGVPVKAPSVAQALSDALTEAAQPAPPARVTTPPPASLPPGYTPRTTVPKRTPPARAAAKPPEPPKRAYFLKSPEEIAAASAPAETVAPSASLNVADLPAAWKSHTGQDLFPVTGVEARVVRDAVLAELKDRGMTVGQAIMTVSKNKAIPTALKSQLLRSLSGGK